VATKNARRERKQGDSLKKLAASSKNISALTEIYTLRVNWSRRAKNTDASSENSAELTKENAFVVEILA